MRTSYPGIGSEMGVTGLMEYNENTDPIRSLQTQFGSPSPSIAERAKCFGSIRTGNSSTRKMASPSAKPNSPANSMTSALTESEPLCPANIVAARRILFSPARNSYPNSNPRPIHDPTASLKRMALATNDKENAGDDKPKRYSDVPAVVLKGSCSSIAAPTSEANESPIADKADDFEPKGLVEKRALWLQGRALPSSSVAFPGREQSVGGSTPESTMNASTVAARTTLLQKNLASNTASKEATLSLKCTGTANLNGKQAFQQQSSSATTRGAPRFDNRAQDPKKSQSSPPKALEVQTLNRETKKSKKPKSLVETRAKWLEKQVHRNEMGHDIPSDDEDDVEKPKTDIQLRLEALQKEMMAAQQYVADGVAPKRCLAELP